MKSFKIINQKQCIVSPIKNIILNFFNSLKTKDFLLTAKQIYKIFIFMERYPCTRKEFLSALISLAQEGYLRKIEREGIEYYKLNLIRFSMEMIKDYM